MDFEQFFNHLQPYIPTLETDFEFQYDQKIDITAIEFLVDRYECSTQEKKLLLLLIECCKAFNLKLELSDPMYEEVYG